jgi:uncharacterized protein
MDLSRFVLIYRDVGNDEHVLFNVLTDRYVGVSAEILAAIDRWRVGPPAGGEETEVAQTLLDEGFLVGDRRTDDVNLRTHLDEIAGGMPGTTYVTVMPTLACNLACHYCFQKDHPATGRMDDATEEAMVGFILAKVDAAGSGRLVIHYFGGEPLSRKDWVLRTGEAFAAGMRARGGVFEWELTTNGLGLDVPFARAMAALGKGAIKVTLDGDRETHDSERVYRDGRGTFDAIFAALVEVTLACPELAMRVGGNYRPGQLASYERLIDRLDEAGLAGKLAEVRFKPVVDTGLVGIGAGAGAGVGPAPTSCGGACGGGGAKPEETFVQLRKSVERRGLTASGDAGSPSNICELHWDNNWTIDPQGRVYKCPAVAGRPEMAVGTVRDAADGANRLTQLRPWRSCGDCAFIPVCLGGCLGGQYLQTGKRDEVFCEKPTLEAAWKERVLARYRDEFGVDGDADVAAEQQPTAA